MSKIIYTIDVEPDLHSGKYEGITRGLLRAETIFDKKGITPILFVTCDCIEKYPEIFKRLEKKGWEIALHGYRHIRFDELSFNEKEEEIKKSISCFKKYLKKSPKGFRAPQHSIDNETLDLLEKYNFEYDSSYTPLNFLQLLFFPKKFKLWFKNFFSPINSYKIRKNLNERPPTSLILPFTSLIVRIFPIWMLKTYIWLIKMTHKKPIFYIHSWDLINVEKSKIERFFSHKKLIKKLKKL